MDLPDGNWWLFTYGLVYSTNKEKFIDCYVDDDFSGWWSQSDADNAENFMLRTESVIIYEGCPVLCYSKLPTEIALIRT